MTVFSCVCSADAFDQIREQQTVYTIASSNSSIPAA